MQEFGGALLEEGPESKKNIYKCIEIVQAGGAESDQRLQ